jgi:PGF-pre-PGF domain-containing protein
MNNLLFTIQFEEDTPVVYLSFDSKKTTGMTSTIVEMLKGKSSLVKDLPSDEVYKSLNIWVGNGGFGDSNNIGNAVINFKVEKSWIKDKNIDKSSITLNRYVDSKWNQLPSSLSGGDDKYLYFTAQTPGFSPFAITGKAIAKGSIQPETGDKAQNSTGNETQAKPDNVSTAINNEQTKSPNTSGKGSTKTPGFEIVYGIACLLYIYKRKDKN